MNRHGISVCISYCPDFPDSELSFQLLSNVTKKHQQAMSSRFVISLLFNEGGEYGSLRINGRNSIFCKMGKICPELHIMTRAKFQRHPFNFYAANLEYHFKQILFLPFN